MHREMHTMSIKPAQDPRSPVLKALLVATLLVAAVGTCVVVALMAALPPRVAVESADQQEAPRDEPVPAPWKGAGAMLLDAAIGGFE
jgi:hypothetical protein